MADEHEREDPMGEFLGVLGRIAAIAAIASYKGTATLVRHVPAEENEAYGVAIDPSIRLSIYQIEPRLIDHDHVFVINATTEDGTPIAAAGPAHDDYDLDEHGACAATEAFLMATTGWGDQSHADILARLNLTIVHAEDEMLKEAGLI